MAPRPTSLDPSAPAPPAEGSVNPWVERWQAGINPEGSFRQIFRQYYGLVFSYFNRKGFSIEESQDLAQDTFLRVHKSLSTFRREARFETWLFQITANVYRNTLRAQSTRKRDAAEVSLDEIFEPGNGSGEPAPRSDAAGGPLDELLSEERSQVLHDALQDLPSQMRRCVLLRVDQDLKYREIADLMRVSIETVKAHLFQARQQLKGKLANYFADPHFGEPEP
jgi:RNA polymerase sigma-70 factor, ECF subfamily